MFYTNLIFRWAYSWWDWSKSFFRFENGQAWCLKVFAGFKNATGLKVYTDYELFETKILGKHQLKIKGLGWRKIQAEEQKAL